MRWSVLAGLTIVAVVLGFVGFERLPEGDQWSFWDSLHRSVQLFVLESGGVQPPVPWQLEVARFLAPAVTVAAAGLALVALFREQARLLRVRLAYRGHVVVAGLGAKGLALARQLDDEGDALVAIDHDAAAPGVAACRERGIPVVVGDATDAAVLARAGIGRAGSLLAVCGEDGANSEVASAARRVGGAGLTVFAHLDDRDLWRHLAGHELGAERGSSVRVAYFNLEDARAAALMASHPPFEPGAEAPHVVVAGVDGVGESVVLHVARQWLAERSGTERLRLTVYGTEAERAALLARHPALSAACDVNTASADAPPVTAAYVCTRPDGRAVSTALALRASGVAGDAPVVVLVGDEERGVATALDRSGGVVPFGLLNTRAADLANQSTIEVLARAKHAQYVRDEVRRGRSVAENPSIVPWHELEESLRESNRRFAEGVGEKLGKAGLVLVPAALPDPGAAAVTLPEEQVEELAIAEHDRWMADLVADGWRHGPGPKDPVAKTHPSLVPWAELSEEERDKDREPVRALPEMLAHVGFELRRASGGEPARGYAQPALP
jgi:voltage-gated potassium channel Kch